MENPDQQTYREYLKELGPHWSPVYDQGLTITGITHRSGGAIRASIDCRYYGVATSVHNDNMAVRFQGTATTKQLQEMAQFITVMKHERQLLRRKIKKITRAPHDSVDLMDRQIVCIVFNTKLDEPYYLSFTKQKLYLEADAGLVNSSRLARLEKVCKLVENWMKTPRARGLEYVSAEVGGAKYKKFHEFLETSKILRNKI